MGKGISRPSGERRWHRLYVAVLGKSSLRSLVRSCSRRHTIQQLVAVAASRRIGFTSRYISGKPGSAGGKEIEEDEKKEKGEEEKKARRAVSKTGVARVRTRFLVDLPNRNIRAQFS